jgi:type I restriction enzyme S subunit
LDDKIESNRRLVRILEQLGRAELATALAGSGGEAWEDAWPEMNLGDALSLIETGDRPKGGVGEIAAGVPSVGAESIVAPGVFDFSKTKFVPEEYFARMRRGVLQSGDVLLYKDGGTPGNFIPKVSMCQDGFPFEVAALNSHVYRLRVEPPYSQAFLYFWLSSQRLLDEMWLRGTGAAIPSLNSTNVRGLPFPVIPASLLAPVSPVVDGLISYLHRAAREQRTLEQLRDALLPELLSGRLRPREVEEMVGSV